MKTEVIMIRDLDGVKVSQRSKDGYFNATELLNSFNAVSGKKKMMPEFWSNKNTKEFMTSLSNDLNISNVGKTLVLEKDLYTTTRGQNGGTYMHPYLFVKFAMWLSTDFEVKVIRWVYDNLIDFRNQAGDYYNEMCQAIQDRYEDYYKVKPNPIVFIEEANFLNKLVYGSQKGDKRNSSNEDELSKLNMLQKANIKLIKQGMPKFDRKVNLRNLVELL